MNSKQKQKKRITMNRPELLLPAGSIEKLKYALHYGADAVYLGTSDYSLRNAYQGDIITKDNLKDVIQIAHDLNKKAYVTINIFAHNEDIDKLPEYLELVNDAKPDAIIFSDIGVGSLIKKYCPGMPLHLSTQANTCNYSSAQAWQDFGVQRIILARELNLKEIAIIKDKTPGMELEVFIHGSLCISYSGRCIMSDFMTDNERKANKGTCAQPCRWVYNIVEETRPGQFFPVMEDDRGTYIMNSKDLCLVEYIKDLMDIGIDSLKVEGRTKSIYYVSIISRTYRDLIDKILNQNKIDYSQYLEELKTTGNRNFTTNFITSKPSNLDYNYETSKGKAGLTFLAISISDKIENNSLFIRAKNKIKLNTNVEWLSPNQTIPAHIDFIKDIYGNSLDEGKTNSEFYVNAPEELDQCQWVLLRSKDS